MMTNDIYVLDDAKHVNRELAAQGDIERFSHVRPATGKRGRPGVDQINGLPEGDVLFVDEITGIAYQGRATLSRQEVSDHVFEGFALGLYDTDLGLPIIEVTEEDLAVMSAAG